MSELRDLEQDGDDGGETLVTPRFDEEETVLAQPVVPLDADAEPAAQAPHVAAGAAYAPGRRAQWPLALILISALAGSVVGGTALYFFQKHRRASAPAPVPAPVSVEAAQPEAAQPQPTPAVEQAAEAAPVVEAAEPVEDKVREEDDNRADRIPTPAPPPVVDTGAPKRGKKAEDEDAAPRRERREDDSRSSGGDDGRREARRVDAIVYPTRREQRRAERREQRRAERQERRQARNVDRVRAIFEGQP